MGQLHSRRLPTSIGTRENTTQPVLLQSTLNLENIRMVSDEHFRAFIESSPIITNTNEYSTPIRETTTIDTTADFDENCSIYERKLPQELFIHILGYLHNRELFRFKRVCKKWKHDWIENINLWKGRLFGGDSFEPFMYFKPILETPMKTISHYYNEFMPNIYNSFSKCLTPIDTYTACKFVLVGPEQCGKSELMKLATISDHEFQSSYTPTASIGLSNSEKYHFCNDQTVKIQIWDFSGKLDYHFCSTFILSSRIIIYCFDLSDENSFTKMKEGVAQFLNEFHHHENTTNHLNQNWKHLIIIGMKRDLERQVSFTQIGEYISELAPESVNGDGLLMSELKVQYLELSNKTDTKPCLLFPFLYGIVLIVNH